MRYNKQISFIVDCILHNQAQQQLDLVSDTPKRCEQENIPRLKQFCSLSFNFGRGEGHTSMASIIPLQQKLKKFNSLIVFANKNLIPVGYQNNQTDYIKCTEIEKLDAENSLPTYDLVIVDCAEVVVPDKFIETASEKLNLSDTCVLVFLQSP